MGFRSSLTTKENEVPCTFAVIAHLCVSEEVLLLTSTGN
jgi:hypothetical protein